MSGRVFLTAEWRYLAMLNYAVDPRLLAPRVPPGTELDLWNGTAYVSMVGFLFLRTRVLNFPIPFHQNFEEINLRFYVRHQTSDGVRRGVAFIKEIVPRRAIASVARLFYGEPYVARPMQHRIEKNDKADSLRENGAVEYGWFDFGRWNTLRAVTIGAPVALAPDSEAEFIAEHYWGYTTRRDGGCSEYKVEHPPWRVWQTSDATLDCDVARVYGDEFASVLSAAPRAAFVAEGSPIRVMRGRRIERN
jgi:uncharacterized protein